MLSDEEKAVLKTAKENYGLTSTEQKILVNLIEKQSKIIQAMAGDIFIEIIKPDGQHFATEEEVIKFYEKVVGE